MCMENKLAVLILCAGGQKRFRANYPKQLAVFHNQPLLHRTITQCNLKQTAPYIVTHNQQIIKFTDDYLAYVFRPYNDFTICNTLLNTQSLWQERTIVLLGDVYYTADTIDKVWQCNQDLCIYSNSTEIFALSFEPHQKIVYHLSIAATTNYPKLWAFYRLYCGFHHRADQFDTHGIMNMIDDETGDIDTVEQYEHYKKILEM